MGAKCGGSLEEVFMSGLKKYTPAIIKLTANKKIIVDLQKVVATFRTESQRNHGNFISALIGIICLFKEKPYKIIQINEGAPCAEDQMEIVSIKCKEANLLEVEEGAYSLIIEGEMVSEADTFIDIFLALIASIYTFNLAYPKVWEKSLLFIQNIIMNLKDGEDIDRRLISVLADLNKEM